MYQFEYEVNVREKVVLTTNKTCNILVRYTTHWSETLCLTFDMEHAYSLKLPLSNATDRNWCTLTLAVNWKTMATFLGSYVYNILQPGILYESITAGIMNVFKNKVKT